MHLPSPEAVPSLSGSPVLRPLAPLFTASRRGPGRAGRPAYTSTAPLLEAAADAVRERGWMQGATLGDEQAGRRMRPDEYLQARKRRHGLPCRVETV